MKIVGLKVLKNKLSEYVRIAAGGETVLVTDRDRVVAELNPPSPGHTSILSDPLLSRGIREGWFTPAKKPHSGLPPRKPVMTFDELMEDLRRDREDR